MDNRGERRGEALADDLGVGRGEEAVVVRSDMVVDDVLVDSGLVWVGVKFCR